MAVLSGCEEIKTGFKLRLTSFDSKEGILARVNPSKPFPLEPQRIISQWRRKFLPILIKWTFPEFSPLSCYLILSLLHLGTFLLQFSKGRKSQLACSWHWGFCPWSLKTASCSSPFPLVQQQWALRIPLHLDVPEQCFVRNFVSSSVCNFSWAVYVFKQLIVSLCPATISFALSTHPLVWFSLIIDGNCWASPKETFLYSKTVMQFSLTYLFSLPDFFVYSHGQYLWRVLNFIN